MKSFLMLAAILSLTALHLACTKKEATPETTSSTVTTASPVGTAPSTTATDTAAPAETAPTTAAPAHGEGDGHNH